MTMFGRDSIFTSLQALPFTPELAATTLRALGDWQGTRIDDFRDEDPGRILHEMRYGEMTAFEERPHSPYYGCADATPLYVVLLDEYERWTGDRKLVRDLEHEARAALNWIDEYADLQGNGYIWYQRRNEKTGLENQCWKDSWDSISYRDGRLPGFPRATCELQGYAYDAKVRGARLARAIWKDPAFADELEKQAADLKRRFNRDFWVEDGEYFALALDTEGKQVDALTSNNGHLLWSGIVDKSKAKAVARHLMGRGSSRAGACARSPRARAATTRSATTSARSGRSTTRSSRGACAATASRTRRRRSPPASSTRPSSSTGACPRRSAATSASMTKYPVQYPTACSPQAWSTGAPLLLLRTMLGLEPHRRPSRRRPGAAGRRSATWSCSTSRAAGAGSTPSGAAASTSNGQAGVAASARLEREEETSMTTASCQVPRGATSTARGPRAGGRLRRLRDHRRPREGDDVPLALPARAARPARLPDRRRRRRRLDGRAARASARASRSSAPASSSTRRCSTRLADAALVRARRLRATPRRTSESARRSTARARRSSTSRSRRSSSARSSRASPRPG